MDNSNHPKTNSSVRTVDLTPHHGEIIKPAEMIDVVGVSHLSLSARKVYNTLIANAFSPEMAEYGREWTIELSELRRTHMANERVSEDVLALMQTIVTVKLQNGKTRRVQLLGGNDMDAKDREHGKLTYSFDHRLVELLKNSTVFGKLEVAVMMAFGTKYGLALYEAVARRVRLSYKFSEDFTLEEFRHLLGVPIGKLSTYGNLNQYAIKPALDEVNAMASFGVTVIPKKQGRKVVGFTVGWWKKDVEELKEAFTEVRRSKVGRKARISGDVEAVEVALEGGR